MLKAKSTLLGLCASLAFVQATTVYATHTPFLTTDVVAIDALTVPGTVPPGTFSLGTYVSGGSETGTSPPNDWDFTSDYPAFDSTAANALDRHWIKAGDSPIIWDLHVPSDDVLVFPSIDHSPNAPAPYEALEFTVWGSADPKAPFPAGWTLATLSRVYADGWIDVSAERESDDFASLWTFRGGATFQFIAVYANRSHEITPSVAENNDCSGEGVWCSGDDEIDAVAIPLKTDHFKCYDAKGEPVLQTVHLRDQFGDENALVGEPKFFCNPINKNGEGILNPEVHLICYNIPDVGDKHGHERHKQDVVVENQFGDQTLKVKNPKLLCVPSKKLDVISKDK